MHSRGVERWLAHRLSARLGAVARPGRRRVRQPAVPVPRPPGPVGAGRGHRRRPGHRPVAARAVGLVAARRGRGQPRRALARTCSPATSAAGDAGDPKPRPPVRGGAPPRRPVRPLRRAPPVDDPGLGRRRRPSTATASRSRDDARVAGRAVAAAARMRSATPSPAERLVAGCAALAADPTLVDLPDRLFLFGLTRLPASYLDVLRALAVAPRRAPAGAAPVAGGLGHRRPGDDLPPPAAARLGPRQPRDAGGARPPRWPATPGAVDAAPPRAASRAARRCCTACRPRSVPTTPPPAPTTPARCSTPATAPCRSTPATAGPARPRSSATRSPTSSPTTRRSSRATSS